MFVSDILTHHVLVVDQAEFAFWGFRGPEGTPNNQKSACGPRTGRMVLEMALSAPRTPLCLYAFMPSHGYLEAETPLCLSVGINLVNLVPTVTGEPKQ